MSMSKGKKTIGFQKELYLSNGQPKRHVLHDMRSRQCLMALLAATRLPLGSSTDAAWCPSVGR